jgi:7-carboxy-7-deazaguanine synthase (Cx14CxxC type)
MAYRVKEIVFTIQGEGAQTGQPAVFLRFAGCNLWSGREADRAKAICRFCDTDFVGTDGSGGGEFATAAALAQAVESLFPVLSASVPRWVVCTGGEPLLQLDSPLVEALHEAGLKVAVETNGTLAAPSGIDWLCVSPKANSTWVQRSGDELKLIFPQEGLDPQACEALPFRYFYLQPMDSEQLAANQQAAVAYCLAHPQWRLSIQIHKLLGLP